jgi:hypothetical protein
MISYRWEDSESMIARAGELLGQGGANFTEQGLIDGMQTKLLNAKVAYEARSRGLEALAAGSTIAPCDAPAVFPHPKQYILWT